MLGVVRGLFVLVALLVAGGHLFVCAAGRSSMSARWTTWKGSTDGSGEGGEGEKRARRTLLLLDIAQLLPPGTEELPDLA